MINPNTGRRTDAIVKGDYMDAYIERAREKSGGYKIPNVVYDYPETLVDLLKCFVEIWCPPEGAIPSKKQKGKYNNWVLQLEDLNKLFSNTERMKLAMKYSYDKYEREGHHKIIHQPATIKPILIDGISELRRIEKKSQSKSEKINVASEKEIKDTVKDLKKLFEREDE